MWPFKNHALQPPRDWAGPVSFGDWTEADIVAMSKALRKHGQADSDGWQKHARICLNTLRGGRAVELVAREMEKCLNPGHDPDRPIDGNHYMRGMPSWCVWIEDARASVKFYAERYQRGDQ